jgi:uncharacterized protein (TIGR02001 family)
MKKTLQIGVGALGLALATATPAMSAPLSANAAVTSNYIFRGISQSGAQSAVQAGLDYDLGSVVPGLAVGTWASSIDFGHATIGDDTPMELDLYGSYTGSITDKFGYAVGLITYNYPNAPTGVNYNWYEVWGSLSYNFDIFSVTGKVFYAPDYVNLSDSQWYYTGGVTIPIASWLAFSANIGRTELDHAVTPIIKSYTDWNLSLAATFDAYTLTIGYASTDLDGVYKVTSGPFETDDQFFAMISFKLP